MSADICFSTISHGHGPLLDRLLCQLNGQPQLKGVRVIITLNLFEEIFDETRYENLDLLIIRNRIPKGFGENHNAAFMHCTSRWFGILNPDLMLLDNEPFTQMINRLDSSQKTDSSKIAMIAPRVVAVDLSFEDSVRENLTPWSIIRRILGRREALLVNADAQQGAPFYWIAGMCLLVKAEAFQQINGFDERFFLYCEDYDLCARLYNAGWALRLDEQALIIHEAQRDSHRSKRHLIMHLTSLAKVWLSSAFWRITLKLS